MSISASRAVSTTIGRLGRPAPQPPADLDPVDVRQAEVEQHEVRAVGIDRDQRRPAAQAALDGEAALHEHGLETAPDRLVVLDDQYAAGVHRPMLVRAAPARRCFVPRRPRR